MPVDPAEIAEQAKAYAAASQATNTQLAYSSDWRTFQAWCDLQGAVAMPTTPATVAAFLVATAGVVAVTTQRRRLSAIQDAHKRAGHHLDLSGGPFREVWSGIRRVHGRPPTKKSALMTAALRHAIEALPDTLAGTRDRALLLLGFAGALRRTELAAIEVSSRPSAAAWVEEGEDGLTVYLARSKGDQEGVGQRIGIPYGSNLKTCPVRAWRAWLQVAGITEGPAFRAVSRHGHLGEEAMCDHSVALIIKRTISAGAIANGASTEEAALMAKSYGGHSLRRGLATSAARNKVAAHLIQQQLRHKKYDTTAGYIQEAQLLQENAAGLVGL
ncbi:hypothetical protein WN73_38555 [Bradyrhizobium sp. CCBAU 45394]|nr:hypothetical protein [Bradyrhizobium sp. CCBAU 45394]